MLTFLPQRWFITSKERVDWLYTPYSWYVRVLPSLISSGVKVHCIYYITSMQDHHLYASLFVSCLPIFLKHCRFENFFRLLSIFRFSHFSFEPMPGNCCFVVYKCTQLPAFARFLICLHATQQAYMPVDPPSLSYPNVILVLIRNITLWFINFKISTLLLNNVIE